MPGPSLTISGVTFKSLQLALTDLYFRHKDMTQEEFEEATRYVVPMQNNAFLSPFQPDGPDTVIQYWIDSDERLVHDRKAGHNLNVVLKTAHISLRFIGAQAEEWAKAFHHLTKRYRAEEIFLGYCNARLLPNIGSIIPAPVDYFTPGNTAVGYNISFSVEYDEVLDYNKGAGAGDRLEYISLASGIIVEE